MGSERVDALKREIASEPLSPYRLAHLIRRAAITQGEISADIARLWVESQAITALGGSLMTLWKLTKSGNQQEPPAQITLDESTLDMVFEAPRKRLSGNLRDLTLSAAEAEAMEAYRKADGGSLLGQVVHVDVVYDRLVKSIEHLIRVGGFNTTPEAVLAEWKHPKSAIASVLYQSRDWRKVGQGEYEFVMGSADEPVAG